MPDHIILTTSQAFINLFTPSAWGIQHCCHFINPTARPHEPPCSTPCSHSAIVISMAYRRCQWLWHQWLKMTMRPQLTGQEELLLWKAFLPLIWFDISGQKLNRNRMWISGTQWIKNGSTDDILIHLCKTGICK